MQKPVDSRIVLVKPGPVLSKNKIKKLSMFRFLYFLLFFPSYILNNQVLLLPLDVSFD